MRWALVPAFIAVTGATAATTDGRLNSTNGDEYSIIFNANGAVLTSTSPKFYPHLEPSENHELVVKKAVIYLGANCDAIHDEFEKGQLAAGQRRFLNHVQEWRDPAFQPAGNGWTRRLDEADVHLDSE